MKDGEDPSNQGRNSPTGSDHDIMRSHLEKKNMYNEIRQTYKQNQIAGRVAHVFGNANNMDLSHSPQIKKGSDFFVKNKGNMLI